MPKPIVVSLGTDNFTINTGDLTSDTIAQFPMGALALQSDILAAASGRPISSLSTDKLAASIEARTALNWRIGSISLEFSPAVQGSLTIRKAGEVFQLYRSGKRR